jgi:hypothetical protein
VSFGIGIVVSEIEAEPTISQKLKKNMIRWYVVESLLPDRSTKQMTAEDEMSDTRADIVGTICPALVK